MESLIDLQHLTGEYLWDLGVNIIVALVILVVGRLADNAISDLTRRLLQRSGLEEILVNFATTITIGSVHSGCHHCNHQPTRC